MKLLIKFIFRSVQWLCLFLLFITLCSAQHYPTGYFRSPLEIPLRLSGNFGELRAHHFHSGLDLKTDSVIGKQVLAAADGYISRVKVSTVGFGKALYITHPNGFVTVYGHLHHFADTINHYVELDQYKNESFETELFPDSSRFCVSKGDLIGWSGNTGGSEGPHLHFEIRDARTEKPINPLLFGFDIGDTIPPVLEKIIFRSIPYPERGAGNEVLEINKSAGTDDTIELAGHYGLELKGYDLASGQPNTLGIYQTRLYADDSLVYSFQMSSFAFDETRYVNAHIDYPGKISDRGTFERCYRLPGDRFSLGQENKNSVLEFLPGTETNLRLELEDEMKNVTVRNILVCGKTEPEAGVPAHKRKLQKRKTMVMPLRWDTVNTFSTSYMTLIIPKGALYEDTHTSYELMENPKCSFDDDYLHSFSPITPAHINCTLSLRAVDFPVILRQKALIAQVVAGNRLVPAGGTFKSDSITTRIRSLGTFRIVYDTVPPVIESYILKTDSLFNKEILSVKISDNLSGIGYFRAMLDGRWILMEYDEKTGTLFYTFHDRESVENKNLVLKVTDKKENEACYETIIRY